MMRDATNMADKKEGTAPDSRLSHIHDVDPRDVYGIAPQPHASADPRDNVAAAAAKLGETPRSAFSTGSRDDEMTRKLRR